mmetsp:Transcript_33596/g.68195  ORF Transcript_33596/g.68195 Transcript_33596/m.68195 type:complete len:386 (-) Transcript_33596:185-1342(-)
MFSKKRKSSTSTSTNQQQRLFSTLASIEQTDERATQKRKQSHQSSLTQSKAANDQVKLNAILLELRILMQRCLDVGDDVLDGDGDGGNKDVQVEVDSLMENLLMARRELLGHEMKSEGGDNEDGGDDSDSSDDDDDVDYAELIQKDNGTKSDESNDETSSSSSEDEDDDNNNLSTQLQNEYESLRTSWKTILNKHHSNLALHSGMSVNSSKFQSKAVDLSFWDQVKFAMSQGKGGGASVVDAAKTKKDFDDSKLYQQMLKDFISQSSSSSSSGGSAGGKKIDPAQEAATRLKRAMRKKNGGEGDVDLTTLLLTQEGGASSLPSSTSNGAAASNKANVDRRASKGRKIRYTVHPKLVNFTFPVSRPEPMIKEDIWFKSLFGGVGKV